MQAGSWRAAIFVFILKWKTFDLQIFYIMQSIEVFCYLYG